MKNNTELLKIAQKYIGQGGARFRKFCGLPSGAAWCNAFVDYIANEGGVSKLYFNGKKETYCPHSIKWCQANLAQIPLYLAMPMDIIYFDWEKNGVPNHIGFVRAHKSTDSICTIEGNTGNKVQQKTRPAKYVQAVFRPHFPTNASKKKLVIDGDCGYNTIYNLQIALGMKPTGMLTKETVKILQKKVGATPDGVWLNGTSKKVQKMIGAKQDGDFGPASVQALQRWCNKVNYPQKTASTTKKSTTSTTTPKTPKKTLTKPEKAVQWAKEIAKGGKYTYKKWSDKNKKTQQCPICHKLKGKYKGWNCIGFVSACFHHGAGVKTVECSCRGIGTSGFLTKVTLASWKKRNGKDWKLVTNGGKKGGADIPASKLAAGDIVLCYDAKGSFHHVVLYTGGGKYIDCTNTSKKHIAERAYTNLCKRYHVTRAFRYTGK